MWRKEREDFLTLRQSVRVSHGDQLGGEPAVEQQVRRPVGLLVRRRFHRALEEIAGDRAERLGAEAVADVAARELAQIARDLEPLRKGEKSWAEEVITLFKAIPARLEGDGRESFEVAFE